MFDKFLTHLVNAPRYLLSALVWFYRYTLGVMVPPRCRYFPSCSQYALEALKGHGAVKGSLLAGWRILRCNPFSLAGLIPYQIDFTFIVAGVSGRAMTNTQSNY